MKLPAPFKCDYCDKTKGESNHWLMLLPNWHIDATLPIHNANNMMDYIRPSGDPIGRISFERSALFAIWNDLVADSPGVKHICSESCASKALSKWMEVRLDVDAKTKGAE